MFLCAGSDEEMIRGRKASNPKRIFIENYLYEDIAIPGFVLTATTNEYNLLMPITALIDEMVMAVEKL